VGQKWPAVVSPRPSNGMAPRELQVKCRHLRPIAANTGSSRVSSSWCVISPDVITPENHAVGPGG